MVKTLSSCAYSFNERFAPVCTFQWQCENKTLHSDPNPSGVLKPHVAIVDHSCWCLAWCLGVRTESMSYPIFQTDGWQQCRLYLVQMHHVFLHGCRNAEYEEAAIDSECTRSIWLGSIWENVVCRAQCKTRQTALRQCFSCNYIIETVW